MLLPTLFQCKPEEVGKIANFWRACSPAAFKIYAPPFVWLPGVKTFVGNQAMTPDTISRWFWRHARHLKWVMTSGSGSWRQDHLEMVPDVMAWLPTKLGQQKLLGDNMHGCRNTYYLRPPTWVPGVSRKFKVDSDFQRFW